MSKVVLNRRLTPSEKIRILRKGKSECRTKKNPNAWRVETRMCEGCILIYR